VTLPEVVGEAEPSDHEALAELVRPAEGTVAKGS
jgi:hypothetical protein